MNAPDNASSQAAKQFTIDQFAWLMQVATDRKLPARAAAVAIALTRYFNKATRAAWPSQETLAAMLGVTPRRVRSTLTVMASRGHLELTAGSKGGRHKSNTYRMALKPAEQLSKPLENNDGCEAPLPRRQSDANVPPKRRQHDDVGKTLGETRTFSPETRTISSPIPGRNRPPNLLNEPSYEHRSGSALTRGNDDEGRKITAEQAAQLVSLAAAHSRTATHYPRYRDYQTTYRKAPEGGNVHAILQQWGKMYGPENERAR